MKFIPILKREGDSNNPDSYIVLPIQDIMAMIPTWIIVDDDPLVVSTGQDGPELFRVEPTRETAE